jgi:LacI family transcriptional regulator
MRMVLVNRKVDNLELPSVTADDAAGTALAVAHLAAQGHRRVLHLAGPANTSTGAARSRAFRHAVRDHGLDDDPALVVDCAHWAEADGARALRGVLDSGLEFSAIVAGNDLLALGCYDVFAERGLECPDDVSVVGFNEMPFLDKMRPPLTTVSIPHYEIGFEAARLLLDAIEEPHRHARSILMPASLVVRQSTAPPRS